MSGFAYFRMCLVTLCLGGLLVAGLNFVVDPYGLFDVVEIGGVNVQKPARDGSRTIKSLQIRQQRYDVVVLGSSRVQLGIDPASPAFDGARVFNLGLVDISMYEVEGVVRYLLQHQSPRTVVIGVDLISFNGNHTVNEDYAESGFNGAPLPELYLPRVLSSRALLDSFSTVTYNLADARQPLFDGHGALVRPDGMKYDHREAFRHMIGYYSKWEFYTDFVYGEDSVRALRRALEQLMHHNVQVYLFFSPVHASQLEIMQLMGLYDDFERAKRDLVAILADLNAGDRLQLWDFSGYNGITLEELPAPNAKSRMNWYWEQAHYTRAAGDLLLARMFGREDTVGRIPQDFGVRLGPGNIEAHLERMRQGGMKFHKSGHRARKMVAEIVTGRQ